MVALDGGVHGQPSPARSDARRDVHRKTLGYTVLRVPNGLVLPAPELFVQKVLSLVFSFSEAYLSTLGIEPPHPRFP